MMICMGLQYWRQCRLLVATRSTKIGSVSDPPLPPYEPKYTSQQSGYIKSCPLIPSPSHPLILPSSHPFIPSSLLHPLNSPSPHPLIPSSSHPLILSFLHPLSPSSSDHLYPLSSHSHRYLQYII